MYTTINVSILHYFACDMRNSDGFRWFVCTWHNWKKWHENANTLYARIFRFGKYFERECAMFNLQFKFVSTVGWFSFDIFPKTDSNTPWNHFMFTLKMCWISKCGTHNQNRITITKQSNVFNDIIYSEVKQKRGKKKMMKTKMFMNMVFMKLFEMSI